MICTRHKVRVHDNSLQTVKKLFCTIDFLLNTTRAMIGRYSWPVRVNTHEWLHRKIVFSAFSKVAYSLQDVCITHYFYWIKQAEAATKFAFGDFKTSVDQLQQIELYFSVHCRKKRKNHAMFSFSHRSGKTASKWGKNIKDTGRSPHFDVICCLLLNSRRTIWYLLLEWKPLGGATHFTT